MNRCEKFRYIIPWTLFVLLIGQFDLLTSNSYLISITGLVVILMIFFFTNFIGKSTFLFLMIIYISSFFVLSEIMGHTFAIVAFVIILVGILINKKQHEIIYSDRTISILLLVLIAFNIIGWFTKSEQEPRYLITAVITFFSFILIFNISRKIFWTNERIRVFLTIIVVISIYALFTALINPLEIINIKTPLLFSFETEYSTAGTFFYSMIGRPTTAVGAMLTVFIFPFLVTGNYRYIKISSRSVFSGFVAAALVCVLGFSKSHTIVLIVGLFVAIILMIRYFSLKLTYAVNLSSAILLFSLTVFLSSSFINYSLIFTRFEEQPELFRSFLENPLKMEGTSREDSFRLGLESLERENWTIGYGYANSGQNRTAWLGQEMMNYPKKDFHNTFYSLPQLFGWAGAIAYLGIFIVTIARMKRVAINKGIQIQSRLLGLSFMLYFIIHLLTEYSITALSSPNYLLMLFIMLGLANALYYNSKLGIIKKKYSIS